MTPDFTTREGIKEFLIRIQKDRQADGFKLGKIQNVNLYLTFYIKLEEIINKINDPDLVNLEEIEQSALLAAWDEIKTQCSTFEFEPIKDILLEVFRVSIRKTLEQEIVLIIREDNNDKKLILLSNTKLLPPQGGRINYACKAD